MPPISSMLYRPLRELQEETRHHSNATVYDSSLGYGALRVYHGFDHAQLAKDPYYLPGNYAPDAVLEPQIVEHFFEAAVGGVMPDGEATELPLLSGQEARGFWRMEYAEWAMGKGKRAEAAAAAASVTRAFEDACASEPRVLLHRAVKGLKLKIWEGMTPMSVDRWRRKRLDRPENVYEASEFLAKVIAVFDYLNDPKVQEVMRTLHNRIFDELAVFSAALNELRIVKGEPQVSVTALWEEYIKALFKTTAIRAHGWLVDRIDGMRKLTEDAFDHAKAQRPQPDAENTKICSRLARFIDLERDADFFFAISRYGFRRASNASAAEEASTAKFAERQASLRNSNMEAVNLFAGGITRMRHAMGVGPFPVQLELFMLMNDQKDANRGLRGKDPDKWSRIAGPPPQKPKPEPWVEKVKKRLGEGEEASFGFVIYRWSEYEGVAWGKVEDAVKKDLLGWGEGTVGAEEVRGRAMVQWIEMAGGDVGSYRAHFKALRESGQLLPGIRRDIFLVIDPHAVNAWFPQQLPADAPRAFRERHRMRGHVGNVTFSSTHSTALAAIPTDFEPFVLAADADFAQPPSPTPTWPYPGWIRIQSSLVFEELYAMAATGCLRMEDMWALAAVHPCGVYTGAVTDVEKWRFLVWIGFRDRAVKWVLDRPDVLFFARR